MPIGLPSRSAMIPSGGPASTGIPFWGGGGCLGQPEAQVWLMAPLNLHLFVTLIGSGSRNVCELEPLVERAPMGTDGRRGGGDAKGEISPLGR